ncbi:hypothetical protein CDAR_553771 [Caerostris darwini]|uniref:Uncharacterized protein n=1 Tax=Caerostris darwini TaxID=1538125 RepID=A0AAV4WNF6_9ARAC|nr:hypothetical protein CDAR_553771 [Caerostris darwini]
MEIHGGTAPRAVMSSDRTPEIHKLWMHARARPLPRADISSRISIPQPKEALKAESEASPLQFASEIQISSNAQSSRIRFPVTKFARTLDGQYRLSAVVSIDRTHPSKATSLSLSLWDTRHSCIPISTHTSNRIKPSIIFKTRFFPNPTSACATVANNPAPRMKIHGGSAPPAMMNSDRASEIHKLWIHALLRAEISSRISIPQPKEAVKAKADASPLQFASEIQISVNHNLITKRRI